MKKIVEHGVLIHYPNFIERFIIYADDIKMQLGMVIRGKWEFHCFSLTKVNPWIIKYKTTERKMLISSSHIFPLTRDIYNISHLMGLNWNTISIHQIKTWKFSNIPSYTVEYLAWTGICIVFCTFIYSSVICFSNIVSFLNWCYFTNILG